MTPPSSCLAHTRNCKNTRKHKYRLAPTDPSPKKRAREPHHHPPPFTPTLLHKKSSLHKHTTSRHEHTLWVMPPRCTRQLPTYNLSWFSTPSCQAVIHQVHGLIDARNRLNRRRPRKVLPPHPRSRHPLLLRIAPSLRPRSTLQSILQHLTPLAPHIRLHPTESENPSPSPSS